MGINFEKYVAIILAGGITAVSICTDSVHELQGNEPHFEELFLQDTLFNNGTNYASTGTGMVHLFTANEPHY